MPDLAGHASLEIRANESRRVLEGVLAELPNRSRKVLQWLREGKSYTEIGEEMGISKQGAHKIGQDALLSLKEKLMTRGFAGLDSKGFLKSANHPPPSG